MHIKSGQDLEGGSGRRRGGASLWAVVMWLGGASSGLATPSGLNNIPTADITPHRTVAVQAFSSFGDGANPFSANGPGEHSFWTGFKTGWAVEPLALDVEWGLDSPITPGPTGPLLFQTKVGTTVWEDFSLALGVANVALTDTNRAGDPFTYLALAYDLELVRVHAGYGVQTDGNTVLLGLDRTFRVWDRGLNVNTDLVQIRDGDGWLASVGVKADLTRHFVLEGWANFPDEGSTSFVAKLNFVFTF